MDDLLFDIAEPLGFFLTLVVMVIYVVALVNAARTRRWIWFVLILLSGFAALVYMFVAYESPKKIRAREARRRRAAGLSEVGKERQIRTLEKRVAELEARGADDVAQRPS